MQLLLLGVRGAWTFWRTKRSTLMALRRELEHTNSVVRQWEILMCHVSLNFQHWNYFLKLWKLTHERCVQWNKGLSKHRYKMEISIKTFGYAVRFNVRKRKKKNLWVLSENSFFWHGWTWKNFWPAAIGDSAMDWEVIIVASRCVYPENLLDEKWFCFPDGMIEKLHVENMTYADISC